MHGAGLVNKIGVKLVKKLEDLANYDQPLQIIGSDIDHRMIRVAQENADEVGLGDLNII